MRGSFALGVMIAAPLVAGLAALSACSTSSTSSPPSSGGDTGATPTSCSGNELTTLGDAGVTGKPISRDQACARYIAALNAKAESLRCALSPVPQCPQVLDDFEARLRAANATLKDRCFPTYDEGTIANCECRVSEYTTCADFLNSCTLQAIPDPDATHKCSGDAGSDGGDDSSPTDAPALDATDSATDAGGGG